jgi:hypothetical protein
MGQWLSGAIANTHSKSAYKEERLESGVMAHACNLSYLGSRGRRILSSSPALGGKLMGCCLANKISTKGQGRGSRSRALAHCEALGSIPSTASE